MTRLGRRSWWAVLGTAAGGLLLSLVALVHAPDAPPATEEARGSASVAGEMAAAEPPPAPSLAGRAAVSPSGSSATSPEGRREGQGPARASAQASAQAPVVGRSSAALSSVGTRVVRPQRVQVPAADIDVAVNPVGVSGNRQMRLPGDPRVLGWYRYGPAPGSGTGSAVLAGHVDSRRFGVGPLANLGAVTTGDRVRVRLADGRWAAYRIDSVERFDRQRLPDAIFSRTGAERLRLVTCTGAYLPDAGGYQQNLVVTAVPV